jgi:hypothetical protein
VAIFEPIFEALDSASVRTSPWEARPSCSAATRAAPTPISPATLHGGGIKARIASIPDLIRMKQVSGSPLDIDDIEASTIILNERGPE